MIEHMSRRILAVWTRPLDGVDSVGRVNIARRVRAALERMGEVQNERQPNLLESGSGVLACLRLAMLVLLGAMTGRLLPLQCALFALGPQGHALASQAGDYDVVYADGIRTLLWLRRLRRFSRQVHVVVDLDDLMSLRCEQLLSRRLPIALGYVEQSFPRSFVRILNGARLARLLLLYERLALQRAEREVMELADVVVLLNEREAALLEQSSKSSPRRVRATVRTIPPCIDVPIVAGSEHPSEWRAVFVGSDAIMQNCLTIDYLTELWQRRNIRTPLTIYGRQKRQRDTVANIRYHGYVDEIAQVYSPGSILVCPAFLRGGIKTKVLEGFAHGVSVIGNSLTFEGIRITDYPLCFDDEEMLVAVLQEPSQWLAAFARSRMLARDCLVQNHTAERFDASWRTAVLSEAGGRVSPEATAAPVMAPVAQ